MITEFHLIVISLIVTSVERKLTRKMGFNKHPGFMCACIQLNDARICLCLQFVVTECISLFTKSNYSPRKDVEESPGKSK